VSHNYTLDEVSGQISYADYYAGIDNGNQAYIKKNARNSFLTTRFGLSHAYDFSKNFSNWTTFFYSNGDYRRVSAGADENSTNPNFGLRTQFVWKSAVGTRFHNRLDFGTELQESRSL